MTASRPKYKPAAILGPHDLAYRPVPTNFAGLVHQTQGNAASAADGFEGAFSAFVTGVGQLPFAIAQLDGPLAAAQIEYAALVIDNGAEVGPAINQGIQALNATNAAIDAASTAAGTIGTGASTLPQPNCTPAPPGDGGTAGMVSATAIPFAVTQVANALANSFVITAATAASIGLTATVIGAAIGLTLLALQFIGKGCGPACIDASKTEQIYEAAADNLLATYKLGMLSLHGLLAGLTYFITLGQQHEAAFADKQGEAGSANLTNQISALMTGAQKLPPPKRVPLNVETAAQSFIYRGQWYPDSMYAAQQLTREYLQSVLDNPKMG